MMEDDRQDKGKHKIPHVFDLDRDLVQYHFIAGRARRTPLKSPKWVPQPSGIAERRRIRPCKKCGRPHEMWQYTIHQVCFRCHYIEYENSPEDNDTRSNRDSAPDETSHELWSSRKCIKANSQDVDAEELTL